MSLSTDTFFPDLNKAWDFAKTGVILYVLGLFVNFLYFIQWHVLSVDLIKPSAIVIGIYVWLLADTLLRSLRYATRNLKDQSSQPTPLFYLIFIVSLLVLHGVVQALTASTLCLGVIFTLLMAGWSYGCFFKQKYLSSGKVIPGSIPPFINIPVFAVLFALSAYPNIPQYLGGGHPLEVRVCPSDKQVMLSQFSTKVYDKDSCIPANLLYEGDKDYYFIDVIYTPHVDFATEYRVHKVKKDLIKKIVYLKSNWITFK